MPRRTGIHTPRLLSAGHWRAVDALADACRGADGLEIPLHVAPPRKIPGNETNQFLYYDNRALVGFASLPADDDVEVLGMVHPAHRRKGIGRELLTAVVDECRNRGVSDFLLVCEAPSAAGCAFAESAGGEYRFAEYRMDLDRTTFDALDRAGAIELVPAQMNDFDVLVSIRTDAFGNEPESRHAIERWLHDPAHELLLARHTGRPIGMIRVTVAPEAVWLTSFAVIAAERGRGLGRRILESVIGGLGREKPIRLEVETDNDGALALYRAVGFREIATYRYYRLTTDQS